MEFNDLLQAQGIDPSAVALALHKPGALPARRALCALVEEDPEAFEAYQSTHPSIQEATVKSRPIMASFVPTTDGEMTFAGLYAQRGSAPVNRENLLSDEVFLRMMEAVDGLSRQNVLAKLENAFTERLRFDLSRMDCLNDLRGRLVVCDPGARNYMRLAERTSLAVIEIGRDARLVPPMPVWDDVALSAGEVRSLPREWSIQLAAWRGIYLIVDQSDGARYVGAAYGVENLLGRWRAHIAGDLGVTRELSRRRTEGFRFSILELLSPMAEIEEVTARERKWMKRLDTISNGLNS